MGWRRNAIRLASLSPASRQPVLSGTLPSSSRTCPGGATPSPDVIASRKKLNRQREKEGVRPPQQTDQTVTR